jgi:hypothetical protein
VVRKQLAKRVGILKVAKSLGIGTGTVQRIANELGRKALPQGGIVEPGDVVFRHACQLGFEGIVSKRLGSPYRSGRSRHWVKSKNPACEAVRREAEEDWGK